MISFSSLNNILISPALINRLLFYFSINFNELHRLMRSKLTYQIITSDFDSYRMLKTDVL